MSILHTIPKENPALPPFWERGLAQYLNRWTSARLRISLSRQQVWYAFNDSTWSLFPVNEPHMMEDWADDNVNNVPLDWSRVELV